MSRGAARDIAILHGVHRRCLWFTPVSWEEEETLEPNTVHELTINWQAQLEEHLPCAHVRRHRTHEARRHETMSERETLSVTE